MKIKSKDAKNVRLSWEEVQTCGKISARTYLCGTKDAQWHLVQMRNSPTLRNIKMEKL